MKRLAALALLVIPSLALAQPAPPQRVEGTVSALTDTSMTIKKADGTSETVALLPTRNVNITAPIAVDQIQPGSYVATANKTQADGSGVSTELRVYPATTGRVNVNRAMNADGDLDDDQWHGGDSRQQRWRPRAHRRLRPGDSARSLCPRRSRSSRIPRARRLRSRSA